MDTSAVSKGIQELLPAIRKRRDEIEKSRRMPRDIVDQLRKTGVFALAAPRDVGGGEASPHEIMRAIESVATADGSAGWCTMIGSSGNLVGGYMPAGREGSVYRPDGADRRDRGAFRSSGPHRRGRSGERPLGLRQRDHALRLDLCRLSGHGERQAAHDAPRPGDHPRLVAGGGRRHPRHLVRQRSRGTGSNDFSATDVFVPEQRIFKLLDPSGHRPEPLYQMPPVGMFVFQVVCVSLGIARAALDELTEMAQTKVPTLYTQVLADKAVTQVDFARAEAALGGARAFLFEAVDEIWQTVRSGHAPTLRQIARGRVAATHAAETAARVTRTANTLAGGSAIYNASPMQRHARDAEAITHHFTVAPHLWEEAGRVFLGRQPTTPVF